MAREWQQTKLKQFVMPDAVYYQSIWAVRDLERMEKRLGELQEERNALRSVSIVHDRKGSFTAAGPTEQQAVEIAALEERINGIHSAMTIIPAEYKSFILSNIILKTDGTNIPSKLWRLWKQRFLYSVAKNLSIF